MSEHKYHPLPISMEWKSFSFQHRKCENNDEILYACFIHSFKSRSVNQLNVNEYRWIDGPSARIKYMGKQERPNEPNRAVNATDNKSIVILC